MSEKILRDVWSVEGYPADVYGSDVVSVSQQATLSTVELFAFSISLGNVSTFRTASTCIPRVHVSDWYSCNFSFVLNKALELVESPRMDYSSLVTTFNRYSQSDAFEVFKSYSSKSVLSLLNNPFGDYMVYCCGKSVFFSASLLEQTLSRFCSFSLKFTSDFGVSASCSVEFFSKPSFAITISGYVSNANINAEKVFRSEGFCLRNFDCGGKIELPLSENKVCLPSDSIHSRLLIRTYLHWDFLSASYGEYGYGFKSFPREDTLVINYCAMSVKCRLDCFGEFVGISDFADCSDSYLRGELESFSDFTVNKVMELPIVESSSFKGYFGNIVASGVEAFHSLKESVELGFVWNEFNQESLLHKSMECSTPYLIVISDSSPQLKQGVSSEAFL